MWIRSLSLTDFRNFTALETPLIRGTNIIRGDNAQGKTNFLEALYFCATGRSQRAGSDRELIRFGCREAHLRAELARGESVRTIDVHIQQAAGNRTVKGIAVDRIPIRKLYELFGLVLAVAFSPEDLRLVKAGPAERRAFMDMALCQLSPLYYHELRQYHHALKQRNNLLRTLQTDRSQSDSLFIWDEQLITYGQKVMAYRDDFIRRAAGIAGELHSRITGGAEKLCMSYRPHIANPGDYAEKLKRQLSRDLALGSTSAGAHRDDIQLTVNGCDARAYGSQGQQRTAALSVKLSVISALKEEAGVSPILLLDDVLSELDEHRQRFLFEHIGPITQTVLTCTGVEDIINKTTADGGVKIMTMENGMLNCKGD